MADEEAQAPAEEEATQAAPEPEQSEEDKSSTSGRLKAQKKVVELSARRDPHVLDTVHYVFNDEHIVSTIYEVFEDGTVRLQETSGGISASPVAQDTSGADATFHYPEE